MTPARGQPRKTLRTLGHHGDADRVRVLVDETVGRVVVHYRDSDGPRRKLYANDRRGRADAIQWATDYHAERTRLAKEKAAPPDATLGDVWTAYTNSPAWNDLRPASRKTYGPRWMKWMTFMGRDHKIADTTLLDADKFITKWRAQGMAVNQIRNILIVAKTIYSWAHTRKLAPLNELATFRWSQPKDAKVEAPGDYTAAQMEAMLRTLDPTRHDQWRPWVAVLVVSESGQRANAVRHLQVTDFDFGAGEVVWRAEYQKQGKELRRPITWGLLSAYLTAMRWRVAGAGPWLLYALNDKARPYSYTSLHYQWRQAEEKAGIAHERYRAVHGARRGVVGDVGDATGDRMLGLEFVGDTDPGQLKAYDKRERGRMETAAAAVDARRGTPQSNDGE